MEALAGSIVGLAMKMGQLLEEAWPVVLILVTLLILTVLMARGHFHA